MRYKPRRAIGRPAARPYPRQHLPGVGRLGRRAAAPSDPRRDRLFGRAPAAPAGQGEVLTVAPAHVYLTVREAADRARVSVWTIRRALREGKIEGGVAGRRW